MSTTEQDVIKAIQRIALKTKKDRISVNQYVRHVNPDEPASITAIRLFGSWIEATKAAGLSTNPSTRRGAKRVSDEQAFQAVHKAGEAFAASTGKPAAALSQSFYNSWRSSQIDDNHLGLAVLHQRYGGWDNTKRGAGLITDTPDTTRD